MRKSIILTTALTVASLCNFACGEEKVVFNGHVKIRFSKSATDRRLVDKDADFVLDSTAGKLTVRNAEHGLDVRYDDIQKVVFDVSTRMRSGAMSQVVGGLAGAAIASKHVSHYWCYIEYKTADGSTHQYMVEFPKDESPQAIDKVKAALGDKVTVAEFEETEATIEKNTLKG
jgi:hypothetical protein